MTTPQHRRNEWFLFATRRCAAPLGLWALAVGLFLAGPAAAAQDETAPRVTHQVEDMTFLFGDPSRRLSFYDLFTSHTECLGESSDETVVQVTVDGTRVRIRPMGVGTATVTLIAGNAAGRTQQTFTVTVNPLEPRRSGERLPQVIMQVGDSEQLDVAPGFEHSPERMVADYAVQSSQPDLVAASLDGTMLTLNGDAVGVAQITVTASNVTGSAWQRFAVTVRDIPPAIAGTLDPVSVIIGETATVDISGAFSGTALMFSAANMSSKGTASISLDGTMLSITGEMKGTATVRVIARNPRGRVWQDIEVTVRDISPMVAEMLGDIELRVGESTTVEIGGGFSGTNLEYGAMVSSEHATILLEGTSLMVTGVAHGMAAVTVTATNSANSAEQTFGVNVRDVPPASAGLPDIALIAGGSPAVIDVAPAFSGSALVFAASRTGTAVRMSLAGSHLTVAPAIEGTATITVTASNAEGSLMVSFDATVTTDAAEVEAIERSLAAIGGATLSSVQSAFSARFRGVGTAVPARPAAMSALRAMHDPFASAGPNAWNGAGWQAGEAAWHGGHAGFAAPGAYGGWNAMSMAGGWADGRPGFAGHHGGGLDRTFLLPLAASGGTGAGNWSLWGHADWQSFEGDGLDGDLTSVYVGTDVTLGDDWLLGVAISQSDGDVDYGYASDLASGDGSLATEMLTVFPYARFDVDQCTELWAILGFGSGDLESRRSASFRTSEADLTMSLAAAGASRVISAGEGWSITLLGDASTLTLDTDGITGATSSVEVDVSRVRAGLQGARTIVMDDGARVVLFGEVAARNDSGDGDTGSGAELSAGVRYNTAGRFSMEFKGRILGNHSEDDVEESAFSVSAMLRPRSDGSGLSVALSSRTGAEFGMSGMMPGMDYDYVRRQRRGLANDWGLDARVGYGLSATGLPGLVTPFATLDLRSSDRRGARIGARFDADAPLVRYMSVEVTAGTVYHFYDDTMAGLVELRGEVRF